LKSLYAKEVIPDRALALRASAICGDAIVTASVKALVG
jgi:hypothetical protein